MKLSTQQNHSQMVLLTSTKEEDEFLSDLVIGEIEKPADGLDGDCVIHYQDDYEGHTMKVKLVNGVREGEAIILTGDVVRMKLNYKGGRLNGPVTKMDLSGLVELQGTLVNGVRNGLFKEYCDGVLIWMGYYRDGRRYSVLRKSGHMDGYYEERSMVNNRLLSNAEYDAELQYKNGNCIEYEDGGRREWIYENGVKKPVSLEVGDRTAIPVKGNEETRKRDRPECWDDGLSKRARLSAFLPEFNDDSLIVYNMRMEYEYGILRMKEKCYEVRRSSYEDQLVEVDLNSHEVRVFRNNEWIEYVIEENCIDLDSNGRRWEGGVKDEEPFGYGVVYDEDGHKEYEGFIIGNMKVCHGKEYYDDIESVEYEGCYYNGKRFGKGVLYDRKGAIEYDGIWMNNEHYSSESCERSLVSNHSQCLSISKDESMNPLLFHLSPLFHSLKRIEIGSGCYTDTRSFDIGGLTRLESIEIGTDSFRKSANSIQKNKQTNGICRIMDCPRLRSICFDNKVFQYYHVFELANLSSLRFIRIGIDCFCEGHSFSLSGIHYWYGSYL